MVEGIGVIVLDDLVELFEIFHNLSVAELLGCGSIRTLRSHEVQHAETHHHIEDSLVLKKKHLLLNKPIS